MNLSVSGMKRMLLLGSANSESVLHQAVRFPLPHRMSHCLPKVKELCGIGPFRGLVGGMEVWYPDTCSFFTLTLINFLRLLDSFTYKLSPLGD